jgi:hypothetical protein
VEQNLAYLHQGEVGEGVSQGAEYDYRQGFGSADPDPAFFLIADLDPGLFCEFNSNFFGELCIK